MNLYTLEGKIRALKADPKFKELKFTIPEDIHHYARKVARIKVRLGSVWEGDTACNFMDMLGVVGLSAGRQCFYADRLIGILKEFGRRRITPKDATKQDCIGIMAVFVERDYTGETKFAYALTLQRLVHYSKTGELGSKNTGYCPEVSWITPSMYKGKKSTVERGDLLTPDEFHRIVSKAKNVRDRALLWVMFEGAFRPGEILHMRIGGVQFADRYVMVSTKGKTGQKDIALVLSFRPLLDWYNAHPANDSPSAPLWYSPQGEAHCLTYASIRKILADAAYNAGIKKRVWAYLLRHTQLTELSKKLPDQLLRVYGNWKPGTRMTARYTHLSARDAKNAILELHGILADDPEKHSIQKCPRCSDPCTPDRPACGKCGYLLNDTARAKISLDDAAKSKMRDKLLRTHSIEEKLDALFRQVLESSGKTEW